MHRTYLFVILIAAFYFLSCTSNASNQEENQIENSKVALASEDVSTGKYQLKSGMYKTKSVSDVMTVAMDNSTIVYFDDFGSKELTESVSKVEMGGYKNETHSFSLMIDKMIYNWDADRKTGTKYSIESLMDKNINYEALSEELKKQYHYKELGTEQILGKECKKISLEVMTGAISTASTWKGITMRSESTIAGTKMIIEVVELEENISIEESKFKIPVDVTFTEMNVQMKK